MNNVSQIDCAYIAGFLDGEGTIGLRTGHTKDGHTPSFTLRVRISNTNKDVLLWIQLICGCGHIHTCKQEYGRKTKYELAWSGKMAADILVLLYPYIKVKKLQAEIGIRFSSTINPVTYDSKGRFRRLSRETIIIREQLRSEMDVANDSKNYMSKRGGLS
jgi:hypothetical protein